MRTTIYVVLALLLSSHAMAASLQEKSRVSQSEYVEKQVVKSMDGTYVQEKVVERDPDVVIANVNGRELVFRHLIVKRQDTTQGTVSFRII